jgi:hypothetical protein
MDSTDPAGIGRMSNSRLNKKLPSTQSNLAIKLPLEYDSAAYFGRWVLQQEEFLQQPFWHPESLVPEYATVAPQENGSTRA